MKRAFTILMCMVLLLSTTQVIAECDHVWYETGDAPFRGAVINCTSSYHEFRIMVNVACSKCNATSVQAHPDGLTEREDHSFTKYAGDAGHSGNGVHSCYYKCSQSGCNEVIIVRFECNGPPCAISPINKKPIDEEHQ